MIGSQAVEPVWCGRRERAGPRQTGLEPRRGHVLRASVSKSPFVAARPATFCPSRVDGFLAFPSHLPGHAPHACIRRSPAYAGERSAIGRRMSIEATADSLPRNSPTDENLSHRKIVVRQSIQNQRVPTREHLIHRFVNLHFGVGRIVLSIGFH